MASNGFLLAALFLSCFLGFSLGNIHLSSLPRTLEVTASPKPGQVLKAGVDKIRVTWVLNGTVKAGSDSSYKNIKAKLCYAPVSQVDRAWRKTEDDLKKDKTCQFDIVEKPYNPANKTAQSFEWTVERDVPTGTFFVRAYVFNSAGQEVAYGQTTDDKKGTNLFQIESITGRHVSLDIASVCFSAFSVVSLFGFFFIDKRKAKKAAAAAEASGH
ncbi:hypothetical protein IC582_029694 [Cucumis melo]|uniref:High-affinity nitrate transporter n=2 Tax=Cucumis melo TaxID=3656 RepID=A0A1S3AXC1_CUCME|nr:high-affinity nitrate transporter 3.1 [Cucumis melo]KAA0055266.1 high-affinity nitrate transporter 3.1-like [Cucumis melo var. makuwa]TYJ99190.1 high-affinity nitrate transporter 3.1-like [Cucumis melo var. makuwa]